MRSEDDQYNRPADALALIRCVVVIAVLLLISALVVAASLADQGASVTAPTRWRPFNRAVEHLVEDHRKVLRLDARPGDGVVWLEGSNFAEGSIEVDVCGKDVQGQSFVGIAFRGVDDTHYDAVYFRPFNFRTDDPVRVVHAVQYISLPSFTWSKLREESPGKYEKPIGPVPEPNDWFRARIVVEGQEVRVYVNGAMTPTLSVAALSKEHHGMVGLHVGNGSAGDRRTTS